MIESERFRDRSFGALGDYSLHILAKALRFVQIVDSPHLNFDMLLGTFATPCPTGVHVQHLQARQSAFLTWKTN